MIACGMYRSLFIVFFFFAISPGVRSQTAPSVLAEGAWLKLAVDADGLYRIDPAQLKAAGWDTPQIDPNKLQLYGYGGGMLPQPLDSFYHAALPENAIWVQGAEDGRFDDDDYILFYGQSPHRLRYQPSESSYTLDYEKNLYADSAYYFLTVGDTDGQRVMTAAALPEAAPVVDTYDDYLVYEADEFNLRKPDAGSGREWYGETLADDQLLEFSLGSDAWSTTQAARVGVVVLGTATEEASLSVSLNNQSIGELSIPPIEDARYAAKGQSTQETFTASAGSLPSGTWQIGFRYRGGRVAYLDRFWVEAARPLAYSQENLLFRSLASTQRTRTTFRVATDRALRVWDVTDPRRPVRQPVKENGTFTADTRGTLREFVAVAPEDVPRVRRIETVANQNLKDGVVPNLVIISPPALATEAERLAGLRRQHDGLTVRVVTPPQIYHEFASGRQDVSAIRNYLKYLYNTDSTQLQHLLLFGKGSYDYLDYLPYNTNLVPTYQSRNSVHPIYSYSSDDYFAFLEDHEGEWEESRSGDHTMDIGVGRLPVKTVEEARTVVDKLIYYATHPAARGRWRNEVVFVADDGDSNKHQRDAEQLTQRLDTTHADYSLNKIYLDAFPQEDLPGGEASPATNRQIEQALKRGALIVNFTGHGSETRWTQENIFNLNTINELRNYDRLPFFVTATCEFGRHDDPARVSGAEQLVLSDKGGAIGLVTTARPVFSNSNLLLNKAFYEQVFRQENGKPLAIGEVFRRTKNNALNGPVNRNFALLGDPSMTLAYPEDQVVIAETEVRQPDGSYAARDTLATLDRVRLSGQIVRRGNRQINSDFNGTVTVEILDEASVIETRGSDDSVPMQFKERDNVLHRGRASVRRGQFTLEFIMPHTVTDTLRMGKISAYAQSARGDAHGANLSFVVGGPGQAANEDRTPPQVRLFVDDTTFVTGGLTTNRPTLLAQLADEHGINVSASPDESLTATLTHRETTMTQSWSLSDFYETDTNTYQSGEIRYPFGYLENGRYTLSLRAADTYGNVTEAATDFVVGDESLQLLEVFNYPNPFNRETTFVVDHNRPGDDLSLFVRVVDQQGRIVRELQQDFPGSNTRLKTTWEAPGGQSDQALPPGLYVARILVRSLTDQVAREKFHKLIISP